MVKGGNTNPVHFSSSDEINTGNMGKKKIIAPNIIVITDQCPGPSEVERETSKTMLH